MANIGAGGCTLTNLNPAGVIKASRVAPFEAARRQSEPQRRLKRRMRNDGRGPDTVGALVNSPSKRRKVKADGNPPSVKRQIQRRRDKTPSMPSSPMPPESEERSENVVEDEADEEGDTDQGEQGDGTASGSEMDKAGSEVQKHVVGRGMYSKPRSAFYQA